MSSDQMQPRDAPHWAKPVSKFSVTEVPVGATNLNVDGRQIVSPLQGFGQLWQKTYRVRLTGLALTPAEVMRIWKAEFPKFQPSQSRFYPPLTGIEPGKIIFIDLDLPVTRGLDIIPVAGGVMVLYADDEAFTVTTPEGFPVSGWNTFSVYQEEDCLVAQIQSLDRAADPIYEIGTRWMGGHKRQEENWVHVLSALAARFGIQGNVETHVSCLDPRLQWREAKNIFKNGSIITFFYKLAAPLRSLRERVRRKSKP